MSHLWQAATGQRLPLQAAGYRPRDRTPQGSAISTLPVPLRHTGLEPDFGSPLGASDARVASSAGEPGSANFVSQGCGSAPNIPPTDGTTHTATRSRVHAVGERIDEQIQGGNCR